MTAPVSGIQTTYQPIAASNITNQGKPIKAGYFVVNPPSIRPYSFYDDLKKGDNYFDELVASTTHHKMHADKTKTKKKGIAGKLMFWAVAITAGILAYKKRINIADFFKKLKK